jgi:uncharacterized Zn-binding protein involved in type VI secretion
MPGLFLTVKSAVTCPHGGQVQTVSANTRVLADGLPLATAADLVTVVGCPFTVPPGKPQPCVLARWTAPSTRVLVNGMPALMQTSVALCQSPEQIPQGPAIVVPTTQRVGGLG